MAPTRPDGTTSRSLDRCRPRSNLGTGPRVAGRRRRPLPAIRWFRASAGTAAGSRMCSVSHDGPLLLRCRPRPPIPVCRPCSKHSCEELVVPTASLPARRKFKRDAPAGHRLWQHHPNSRARPLRRLPVRQDAWVSGRCRSENRAGRTTSSSAKGSTECDPLARAGVRVTAPERATIWRGSPVRHHVGYRMPMRRYALPGGASVHVRCTARCRRRRSWRVLRSGDARGVVSRSGCGGSVGCAWLALGVEDGLQLAEGVVGVVARLWRSSGSAVRLCSSKTGRPRAGERVLRDAVRFVPVVEPLVVVVELPQLVAAVLAGRQRRDRRLDVARGVDRVVGLAGEDVRRSRARGRCRPRS